VDDEVDGCRDGRDDEGGGDVLAGEQGERAELGQRLPGAVRVHRAHPRHAGVQGDEHVQALRLAHLADHDPAGSHPQRLLDESSQGDLACALEVRLPALQADRVAVVDLQLEDLLAADHPLAGRDGAGESVEERGLAGLRRSRDEHVQARRDGRAEEARGGGGHRAEGDQVVKV